MAAISITALIGAAPGAHAGNGLTEELASDAASENAERAEETVSETRDTFDQNRADQLGHDDRSVKQQSEAAERARLKNEVKSAYLNAEREATAEGTSNDGVDRDAANRDARNDDGDGDGGSDTGHANESDNDNSDNGASDSDSGDNGTNDGARFASDITLPSVKPTVPDGFDHDETDGLPTGNLSGWAGIPGFQPDFGAAGFAGRITDRFTDPAPGTGAGGPEGLLAGVPGLPGTGSEGGGRIGAGYGGIFGSPSGVESPSWSEGLGRRTCCTGTESVAEESNGETVDIWEKEGDQFGIDNWGELGAAGALLAAVGGTGGAAAGVGGAGASGTSLWTWLGAIGADISAGAAVGKAAQDQSPDKGDDSTKGGNEEKAAEQSDKEGKSEKTGGNKKDGSKKSKDNKENENKENDNQEDNTGGNNDNKNRNENDSSESNTGSDDEDKPKADEEDTLPCRMPGGGACTVSADPEELQEAVTRAGSHSRTTMPAEPDAEGGVSLSLPWDDISPLPNKTTTPVGPGSMQHTATPLPPSFWNPGTIDPHRGN